jgi:hypothetical protein
MNMQLENFEMFSKMWAYYTVRVPQDKNDKAYQKQIIRTVVDIEKILSRNHENTIVSMVTDAFLKSSETEIKFPVKKVLESLSNFRLLSRIFQGIYRFTNLTVDDAFILIGSEFTFFFEVKYVVRVQGAKRNVLHSVSYYMFEFRPNHGSLINLEETLKVLRM